MIHVLPRGKLSGKKAYHDRPHRRGDTALKLERCEGGSPDGWSVPSRGIAKSRVIE